MNQFPSILNVSQDDVAKMLACQVHVGTRNMEPAMGRYVWKRRSDGVHIINLQKTWEKLLLAARVIVAIEHPQDVCAISARPYGQRAVLKFAKYIGSQALAGRFTPGGFTNQIQDKFMEPRLLILTDSRTDHQPLREASLVNIPTIAFCHTDSPTRYVDIAIPCNNKSKPAIGLMWWMLAREVLYLRNTIQRTQPWDVMCDLFLYRDPDEQEKEEGGEVAFQAAPAFENPEEWNAEQNWDQKTAAEWTAPPTTGGAPVSEWGATPSTENWGATPAAAPEQIGSNWDNSAVPSGTWDAQTE